MTYKALVLVLVGFLAFAVFADDEDMNTVTKPGSPAISGPALPADNAGKLPPPAKPPSAADFALRSKVRKHAPFWIDDSQHGAAIRVNKDGTFSSEAGGGGSIAGQWKALKNELHLQWSDGAEKYSYPLSGGKDSLKIRGKSMIRNRYNLN